MTEQEWIDKYETKCIDAMNKYRKLSDKKIKENLKNDDWDYEYPHSIIDEIMCEILEKELGFTKIVARYNKMRKWFA